MTASSKMSQNHTVYDEAGDPHIVTEEYEVDASGQVKPGTTSFKCESIKGPIVSNLPTGFKINGVFYTKTKPQPTFNPAALEKTKAIAMMKEMRKEALSQTKTTGPKKED